MKAIASPEEIGSLCFGGFELSRRPLRLRRDGVDVSLPAQPLKLLLFLASRAGEFVSHDEIIDHLWANRTVEYGRNIHVYIRQIRKALGDEAGDGGFIETIPRQGYRFCAPVTASELRGAGAAFKILKPPFKFPGAAAPIMILAGATFCIAAVIMFLAPDSADQRAAASVNAEAQDAYRRGLYLLDQRERKATEKSLVYFDRALAIDSAYAPAHTASARAHLRLAQFDQARTFAERAVNTGNGGADAHAMLGFIALTYDWQWDAARRHFENAFAADSDNLIAHQGIAAYYVIQQDFDQAKRHMTRAITLDPASTIIWADIGWYYMFAGDNDLAVDACQQALDLAPDMLSNQHCLLRAYAAAGEAAAAKETTERYMSAAGAKDEDIKKVLSAGDDNRLFAFDRWRSRFYEQAADGETYGPAERAFAAAGAGEADLTFKYLFAMLDERNTLAPFAAVDPVYAPYREDPRFAILLKRLGLPAGADS